MVKKNFNLKNFFSGPNWARSIRKKIVDNNDDKNQFYTI